MSRNRGKLGPIRKPARIYPRIVGILSFLKTIVTTAAVDSIIARSIIS
jgi:hypothetical protein